MLPEWGKASAAHNCGNTVEAWPPHQVRLLEKRCATDGPAEKQARAALPTQAGGAALDLDAQSIMRVYICVCVALKR